MLLKEQVVRYMREATTESERVLVWGESVSPLFQTPCVSENDTRKANVTCSFASYSEQVAMWRKIERFLVLSL